MPSKASAGGVWRLTRHSHAPGIARNSASRGLGWAGPAPQTEFDEWWGAPIPPVGVPGQSLEAIFLLPSITSFLLCELCCARCPSVCPPCRLCSRPRRCLHPPRHPHTFPPRHTHHHCPPQCPPQRTHLSAAWRLAVSRRPAWTISCLLIRLSGLRGPCSFPASGPSMLRQGGTVQCKSCPRMRNCCRDPQHNNPRGTPPPDPTANLRTLSPPVSLRPLHHLPKVGRSPRHPTADPRQILLNLARTSNGVAKHNSPWQFPQ